MKVSFLLPPESSDYEQSQKAKLLHYMLFAIFGGSLLTSIGNYLNGWINETIFLSLLAITCLAGLLLNYRRHYRAAAIILCGSLFFALGLLMYHGAGLYDGSVVAYPIFILCVTFLFGKRRGLLIATLLSIFSLVAIYLLQINNAFISEQPPSLYRVIILSFLYVSMAMVTWVVRDTWEINLERLKDSYGLTLYGWAKALEYRDGETAGHSQRVTELAVTLARKLNVKEDEIINIQRGAILHDIGKMAIPDTILQKPGPLNAEEMKIMQQHPLLAVNMISEIPFLCSAISIPRSHHERWDGTGYPDGLAGEEIPLMARIFTVVDQWDALTSDRPYRKAWHREKVIAYIQENSGKIYDPKIVIAFLAIVGDNKFFRNR